MNKQSLKTAKILSFLLIFLGILIVVSYTFKFLKDGGDLDVFYTTTGGEVTVELTPSSLDLEPGEEGTVSLNIASASSTPLQGMLFSIKVPKSLNIGGIQSDSQIDETSNEVVGGVKIDSADVGSFMFYQDAGNYNRVVIALGYVGTGSGFTLSNGQEVASFTVSSSNEVTANLDFELASDQSYPSILKSGSGDIADLEVLQDQFNTVAVSVESAGSSCNKDLNVNGDPSGTVDLLDVVTLLNAVFDSSVLPSGFDPNLDCSQDGFNLIDVIYLLDAIFK